LRNSRACRIIRLRIVLPGTLDFAAPCQHLRLLDPFLAGYPALMPQQPIETLDLGGVPLSDLAVADNALSVEQSFDFRRDSANALEAIARWHRRPLWLAPRLGGYRLWRYGE
jgi:hypothetical protein